MGQSVPVNFFSQYGSIFTVSCIGFLQKWGTNMTLTAQQEHEWNRCMLLGLIQALHQTCQLTDEQFEALMSEHRFLQKTPS